MSLGDVLRLHAEDARPFLLFEETQLHLAPKWMPTWVRIVPELRRSETNKILKRELQREKFLAAGGPDAIYWRPRGDAVFRRFTADDLAVLRERFRRAGNTARLEG